MTKMYNTVDKIFALLCLVVGFFFVKWCLISASGFGSVAVCVAILLIETVYFFLTAKKPLNIKSILALLIMHIFSAGYAFTASSLALFFNSVIFFVGSIYVFYRAHANVIGKKDGDYFFFDLVRAIFVIPFANIGALFLSLFKKNEEKEEKSSSSYVWIGIAVAIVPVIIVTSLLASDSAFAAVLGRIFTFDIDSLILNIVYFNISVPFVVYFFGSLFGNAKRPLPDTLNAQAAENTARAVRFIPRATTYAAVIPLLFVYALFFASQCIYFDSALKKILPVGFSYSQYARQGFYELCTVCVINFIIITAITVFTKRNDDKEAILQRIIKVLLCIFTEALVIIDVAKMMLYIKEHGLTQKRVVTSWFMLLLGLLFLILLLKQFLPKFKITLPSILVTLVLSLVLIFGNVDACVARYNVWAYQSGKLDTVDIDTMYNLDDSAVEYVLPLVYDYDPEVYFETIQYLEYKAERIEKKDPWEYTIYTLKAKKLIEEANVL